MFDFRNHGESGFDPNKGMASIGLKEYQDVTAALNYIHHRDEIKTQILDLPVSAWGPIPP